MSNNLPQQVERLPTIAVAMLGSRMHYAVPRILHGNGQLHTFFTDAYLRTSLMQSSMRCLSGVRAAPRILKMFSGRYHDELKGAPIIAFNAFGLHWGVRRRRLQNLAEKSKLNISTASRFSKLIDRRTNYGFDMIYGFKGAALEIFKNAAKRGCFLILEQPTVPNEIAARLLAQENEKWGEWVDRPIVADTFTELARREREEWALANHIIAPSQFVKDGLVACGVASAKISVVPYGVDVVAKGTERRTGDGPLRILFAGEVGLRKGVPAILNALDRFKPGEIEIRMAGDIRIKPEFLKCRTHYCTALGRIARSEMIAEYERADVFVLPSHVEGSATVTYEALAHGLPVITTPNAGSVVTDGQEGRLVPAGDIDALYEAVREYREFPDSVTRHSRSALAAVNRIKFETYSSNLLSLLNSLSQSGDY